MALKQRYKIHKEKYNVNIIISIIECLYLVFVGPVTLNIQFVCTTWCVVWPTKFLKSVKCLLSCQYLIDMDNYMLWCYHKWYSFKMHILRFALSYVFVKSRNKLSLLNVWLNVKIENKVMYIFRVFIIFFFYIISVYKHQISITWFIIK